MKVFDDITEKEPNFTQVSIFCKKTKSYHIIKRFSHRTCYNFSNIEICELLKMRELGFGKYQISRLMGRPSSSIDIMVEKLNRGELIGNENVKVKEKKPLKWTPELCTKIVEMYNHNPDYSEISDYVNKNHFETRPSLIASQITKLRTTSNLQINKATRNSIVANS